MQIIACKLVNILAIPNIKLNKQLSRGLLSFSIFMLLLMNFFYTTIPNNTHFIFKCLYGSILLFFVILFSINQKIQPIKQINKTFWGLWFILVFFQFTSSVLVSLEYLPMACVSLIEFSLLFYIWFQRNDSMNFISMVFKNFNILFVAYLLISIIFIPIGKGQYSGFNLNPNGNGQLVTMAFPIVLYLKSISKKNSIKLFYLIELVLIITFCYFSESRTALLSLLMMIVTIITCHIFVFKNPLFTLLKKGILISVIVLTTICILPYINSFTSSITKVGDKYEEKKSIYNNPKIEEKTILMEPGPINKTEPAKEPVKESEKEINIIDRVKGDDKSGTSLEDYSSGRTQIWLEGLSKINLFGNPSRNHIITERNGDVGNNLHNTFLQFSYDNGFFAGITFGLLVLYSLFILAYNIKINTSVYSYYILIYQVGFIVTSTLASTNLPFLYSISLIYYFTLPMVNERITKGELDVKY
ncbi:MAG: O-antigen ligase family protein [Malacoplasma sp.]